MKTRGEKHYIKMPLFAAKLYDKLTGVKGVNKTFEEIADIIVPSSVQGKLLDIGTGPGRLLNVINKRNKNIDLYGLDISESMVDLARVNLKNCENVCLQVGNITRTEFQDNFFDFIVSTGSFYNWDHPVEGLNEVYRILKPGKTAYVFETIKDYDKKLLNQRLTSNLQGYSFIRRLLSKYFLMKQLKMTYNPNEFNQTLKMSKFNNNYKIEYKELGNLPIYVQIELNKEFTIKKKEVLS